MINNSLKNLIDQIEDISVKLDRTDDLDELAAIGDALRILGQRLASIARVTRATEIEHEARI